ncbi:MAG: ferrous iron transport protein A [Anaerolineae bacterium]|nr:ferrous iron transport protein A [Anaerolineae bacterium]
MPHDIPLTELAAGEQSTVAELRGGRSFVSRLATLGFTLGAPLVVVQNFGRGPLIVRVRDTRIALGRGEAERVLVQRAAPHA